MAVSLPMCIMLAYALHPSHAHRGDEKETNTQDGNGLMSLQMLPKGNVHSESRKSTPISAHEFHDGAAASLLEQGVGRSEFGQQEPNDAPKVDAHAQQGEGKTTQDGSQTPKGDGTLTLKIQYPYEKFVAGSQEKAVAQDAKSGTGNIHVTVTEDKTATAPAPQEAPPQVDPQQSTPSQVDPPQATPLQVAPVPAMSNDKLRAWVGKDFAGLFKTVSYSVIRIQAIAAEVNWFEPYQRPQDVAVTGSGLAIDPRLTEMANDPIFITNAHVVRDAHDVQIQLPAIGQQFFEAYVPLICDEFDLAVVQLVDPAKFFDELKKMNLDITLQPLPVDDTPLILGMEVASVGFPLGSTSLKLSRGVISGTEEVGDFICYQTTAPISPGSSGGPLFALDEGGELRVIGATFASAASRGAQNTNYVVPAVAIIQVLEQYKKERANYNQAQIEQSPNPAALLQAHPEESPAATMDASPEASHTGDSKETASEEQRSEPEISGSKQEIGLASASAPSALPEPKGDTPKEAITQLPATNTPSQHTEGEQGGRPRNTPQVTSVDSRVITQDDIRKQLMNRDQKLKRLPHFQFRIAPIDAVGIEADPALYSTYGCPNGVFLSKILNTSVFKVNSNPPVNERSFLLSVDGVPLDQFGMGRTGQFLRDPTPFESLMMMKVRPGDTVKVKTCGMAANEKEVEHTISMEWTKALYESNVGITNIVEPFWTPQALQYEVFAGITVMQLSINHIMMLLRAGQPPTLGRWLLPENQEKPRLVITHVEKGTYASRVVAPGMVISKVNDQDIGTLDEYRKLFMPPADQPTWRLETDRGVLFATDFKDALFEQFRQGESGKTFVFCKSAVEAFQKMTGNAAAGSTAAAGSAAAAVGSASLAQTWSASNRALASANTSEERVTRLMKRQALALSAGGLYQGNDEVNEEARRRMRAAQAGFHTLAASEDVALRSVYETF